MEDILATSYPGYDLVTRFNDIDHQHDSSISSDDDQDSDDENDSGKKNLHKKMLSLVNLGGIQQLRGQIFAISWPPPLRGQFLYPERGQKQTFFDPLPPSNCPRSYWMTPKQN